MLRLLLAIFLLALPGLAEYRSIIYEFQGTDCASCNASLPERLKRVRGVESARIEGNAVLLKLAAGNRIRFEQVRDMIEQDGTKVKSVKIIAKGVVREDGVFAVGQTEFKLVMPDGMKSPKFAGEAELAGTVVGAKAPYSLELIAHP